MRLDMAFVVETLGVLRISGDEGSESQLVPPALAALGGEGRVGGHYDHGHDHGQKSGSFTCTL